MQTKIQTKLIVLLSFIIILFVAALLIIQEIETNRAEMLFQNHANDKEIFFDKLVKLKSASQETFVFDYTYWDDMVTFVRTKNKSWAQENIQASLPTFKVDAVWVYTPDWKLVYFIKNEEVELHQQFPLPQSVNPRLFDSGPFCHFFVETPTGLLEINGASIHPSFDKERKTPAQGYFLAGHFWSQPYLTELAELTDTKLELRQYPFPSGLESKSGAEMNRGIIRFSRTIKGWDNRPIKLLDVTSEFPMLKSFKHASLQVLYLLIGFALVLLLVLFLYLTRWVSKPLRLISKSLTTQTPKSIIPLQADTTEFGHIAQLITNFFTQQAELVKEIEEHKHTGETLQQSLSLLKATLESTTDGILVIDRQGKVTSYNKSFLTLWHIPESVAETNDDQILLNYVLEQLQEPQQFLDKVMQLYANPEQQSFDTLEFKDGRIFERYSQPQYIGPDIVGRVWSFRDITDRKRTELKLEQSFSQLRKAMGGTIQALASATELRDPYTAGHQRRVANLARAIATEMNLTKDQVECVRIAGTVHDIGKIYIPAEILTKPTKLTEIEFDLIKTHSQGGFDILKEIEFPWPIAQIVLQHHERLNGSGYPNGVKAEQILPESCIIAIADVVEAMATHRPYRPALGINEALAEIDKNKLILYDANVVDACIRLFTEKEFMLE